MKLLVAFLLFAGSLFAGEDFTIYHVQQIGSYPLSVDGVAQTPIIPVFVDAAPPGSTIESIEVTVTFEGNYPPYLEFENTGAALPGWHQWQLVEQWVLTENPHRGPAIRPYGSDGRCWLMASRMFIGSTNNPLQEEEYHYLPTMHMAGFWGGHPYQFGNAAWTKDLWGDEGGGKHKLFLSPRAQIGTLQGPDHLPWPSYAVEGSYWSDPLSILKITIKGRTP